MASRTQIRVQQLTGSLIDLAYSGSISAPANPTTLGQDDLGAVLGSFAGAIGRITGKNSIGDNAFSNVTAGHFHHNLHITGSNISLNQAATIEADAGTITLNGKAGLNLAEDGANIVTISNDRDVAVGSNAATFDVHPAGAVTIDAVDGSSVGIGTDATTAGVNIGTAGTRTVTIGADGGNTTVAIRGEAADLTLDAGSNDIAMVGAQIDSTAQAFGFALIDNNPNAFSFDATGQADILKIDTTNSNEKVIAHALDVTNDLVVEGSLTVVGASSVLTSSNTVIQDGIIGIGVSGSEGYMPSGLDRGIIFGGGAISAAQSALYYDGGDSKFYLAKSLTSPSSSSFAAPSDSDYETITLGKVEFKGTNNSITLNTDLIIDAQNDIVLDADGDDIKLKYGTNIVGFLKNSSNTLVLSGGHAGGNLDIEANSAQVNFNQQGNRGGMAKVNMNDMKFILSGAEGNDLILGSNNALFSFEIADREYLMLSQSLGEVILSSAGGDQLILASNDGKVGIKGNNPGNTPAMLEFDLGVGNPSPSYANVNIDGFNQLRIDGQPGAENLIVSGGAAAKPGTLQLKGGASSGSIAFFDAGESHSIRLCAPALTADVHFDLPSADGTNGQFLTTDGNGVLSFASAAAGTRKGVYEIGTRIAADGNFDFNSGAVLGSDTVELSGITATQGRVIDVFVNGQLMSSGSAQNRTDRDCDFSIASTTRLNFSFALEEEDVVTIIKRG